LTAAGIAVALAAAMTNAWAIVLQASETRRTPAAEGMRVALLRGLARRSRWRLGAGLLALAGALQVLALALAPITLVQPALSTSLLVLLALTRARLGDRVGALELTGALAIGVGLALVVVAGPHHTSTAGAGGRSVAPLATVGVAALIAFAVGRARPHVAVWLTVGAALAYSWSDFAAKLLAGRISTGHWPVAVVWLAALLAFGAVAFLEESSALQHVSPVAVSPLIDAIKVPVPVLMALWAGAERWQAGPLRLVALAAGLVAVAGGAAALGRSASVARLVSGTAQ
jgi:drug/metabolite transporter (DMT)-like permease